MKTLNANDPAHVSSATVLDADLGVVGRHLLVASGLAMVNWKIDTDEATGGEARVNLGVYARDLESATPFVGLAHVANDETGFVFAVDQTRVDLDPGTGELSLYLKMALMGEWSSLERIGYQVVATVVRAESIISGTIVWPTSVFRPPNLDPATIAPHLEIIANHRTMTEPEGPWAAEEKLTPVASGTVTEVVVGEQTCSAKYRIANPPMAMPLKVSLKALRSFAPDVVGSGALVTSRTGGPEVFTLNPQHSAEIVDFKIEWQRIN